jgi:hypothetical protein
MKILQMLTSPRKHPVRSYLLTDVSPSCSCSCFLFCPSVLLFCPLFPVMFHSVSFFFVFIYVLRCRTTNTRHMNHKTHYTNSTQRKISHNTKTQHNTTPNTPHNSKSLQNPFPSYLPSLSFPLTLSVAASLLPSYPLCYNLSSSLLQPLTFPLTLYVTTSLLPSYPLCRSLSPSLLPSLSQSLSFPLTIPLNSPSPHTQQMWSISAAQLP